MVGLKGHRTAGGIRVSRLQRGEPGEHPDAGVVHGVVRQGQRLRPQPQERRMAATLRIALLLLCSLVAFPVTAKDVDGHADPGHRHLGREGR